MSRTSRRTARDRSCAEPQRRRNVALKTYRGRSSSRGPLLALSADARLAVALIRRYDVKAPGPETPVRNLSGGNLQKLVLGREFEGDPRVLVAAQPTRGLDVGAIETVHAYLATRPRPASRLL